LRAFELPDLEVYWAAVSDIDVAHWAGYVAPPSRDTVKDWYENKVRKDHGATPTTSLSPP
jgi:hypothetical protein